MVKKSGLKLLAAEPTGKALTAIQKLSLFKNPFVSLPPSQNHLLASVLAIFHIFALDNIIYQLFSPDHNDEIMLIIALL